MNYPHEYPLATYLCTPNVFCLLLAPTNATRDELLSNGTTPALRWSSATSMLSRRLLSVVKRCENIKQPYKYAIIRYQCEPLGQLFLNSKLRQHSYGHWKVDIANTDGAKRLPAPESLSQKQVPKKKFAVCDSQTKKTGHNVLALEWVYCFGKIRVQLRCPTHACNNPPPRTTF